MKLLLGISALFLFGCGHTIEKEIIPFYIYMEIACEDYGHIVGINPLPVVFVQGVDTTGNQVLGLRGDMYSNLAINSGETIRYIVEQSKAIGYYEKCIVNHNTIQAKKNEEGGL